LPQRGELELNISPYPNSIPNFDCLLRSGGFIVAVDAEVQTNIFKNIFRSGIYLSELQPDRQPQYKELLRNVGFARNGKIIELQENINR